VFDTRRLPIGTIRKSDLSIGSLVKRGILLFGGCMVVTVCYAVTIRANLGLGPLYVLQDGLGLHAGIAIGTAVIVTGFAFVGVALALRYPLGPGTLVLPVVGGLALDAMLPHLGTIHGDLLRTVAVFMATWVMALGGAMTIKASVGVSSYDAVMLALGRLTGRPLAPIRVTMEATVLVAGWLLGGSVGVGTIITGLLIGPGIQFWLRRIGRPEVASSIRGAAELP
jgi:uncharacterized membrane protein YczE